MTDAETEPIGYLTNRSAGFCDVTPWVQDQGVDFDATDLVEGSKLATEYNGVTHWVYVVPCPDGVPATWGPRRWGRYVYRGNRHKSLTSIARLIVGPSDPRISGNRLFGLRRRRRGP